MATIAQQFGMVEALATLGVKVINEGTSTGNNHFSNGPIIESYSPVDGQLIGKVKTVNSIYNKLTELCEEIIKFCEDSNNLSMKNRIQTRLAQIHYLNAGYTKALELTAKTLIDLKRYEDNLGLIEIQLIESKIHFATKGIAKAKVKRYI